MWEPIPDPNTTTDHTITIHNAVFQHYNPKGALAWVYQKNDEP